jgi:hypothetical protein
MRLTDFETAERRKALPLKVLRQTIYELEPYEETPQVAQAIAELRRLADELEAERRKIK